MLQSKPSPATPRSPWLPSLHGLVLLFVLLILGWAVPIRGDDLWWHLAAGRDLLEGGIWPVANRYSHTAPEQLWEHHAWGTSALFWWLYRSGLGSGAAPLVGLGVGLQLATAGVVQALARRRAQRAVLAAPIALWGALLLLQNFSLRPFLFGNLSFAALLWLLGSTLSRARLWAATALLFALWANLHGSFISGLATVGLWAGLGTLLEGLPSARARTLWGSLACAVLASCATPRGLRTLALPIEYLQQSMGSETAYLSMLSEWQPLHAAPGLALLVGLYLFALIVLALLSGRRIERGPTRAHLYSELATAGVFVLFAFRQIRHVPLMVIATAPMAGRLVLPAARRVAARHPPLGQLGRGLERLEGRSQGRWWPIGALLLAISCSLPAHLPGSYLRSIGLDDHRALSPEFYPSGLIRALRERRGNAPSRLLHAFNWGGALLFELYPQVPVFIDQRNDCYPAAVFLDYRRIRYLEEGWRAALQERGVDAVAFPPDDPLIEALLAEGWTRLFEDEQATLLERTP